MKMANWMMGNEWVWTQEGAEVVSTQWVCTRY